MTQPERPGYYWDEPTQRYYKVEPEANLTHVVLRPNGQGGGRITNDKFLKITKGKKLPPPPPPKPPEPTKAELIENFRDEYNRVYEKIMAFLKELRENKTEYAEDIERLVDLKDELKFTKKDRDYDEVSTIEQEVLDIQEVIDQRHDAEEAKMRAAQEAKHTRQIEINAENTRIMEQYKREEMTRKEAFDEAEQTKYAKALQIKTFRDRFIRPGKIGICEDSLSRTDNESLNELVADGTITKEYYTSSGGKRSIWYYLTDYQNAKPMEIEQPRTYKPSPPPKPIEGADPEAEGEDSQGD